jgi:DNA-binding response OmpR family regulator
MICDGKKQKDSVLVADGENHLGKQLSAMIDSMGYDVVVASNGEEALDLFLKRSFDIVFTALKMPGMDGLTLSLQVKASSQNTPVVLILDEHQESIMNRIKAGRIDCVISKPLSFGEIQKTMQYFETKRSRVPCSKVQSSRQIRPVDSRAL